MNEEKFFNDVYDILVKTGGASEYDRAAFVYDHLDKQYPCTEWRFCGHLGFGGKYRSERNTVDCYREDETPERLAIMQKVNEQLKGLNHV